MHGACMLDGLHVDGLHALHARSGQRAACTAMLRIRQLAHGLPAKGYIDREQLPELQAHEPQADKAAARMLPKPWWPCTAAAAAHWRHPIPMCCSGWPVQKHGCMPPQCPLPSGGACRHAFQRLEETMDAGVCIHPSIYACMHAHLDLNVHSLPAGATQRLVDHDARVGHAVALAFLASAQQEGAHGCCQAKAVGLDVSAAEHHGVIDAHARCDGATCGNTHRASSQDLLSVPDRSKAAPLRAACDEAARVALEWRNSWWPAPRIVWGSSPRVTPTW